MSGDMCTSLGNGFTNLMLFMYVAHKKHGSIEGFVEGDDGIYVTDVVMESSDFLLLGFEIKIEDLALECDNDLRTASFCGLIFSSNAIIRDPRKFFCGFGWTGSFLGAGDKIMQELLRAKALSACYETGQCPIVGKLARYALKVTRGSHYRFVDDGYHNYAHVETDESKIPEFAPDSATRVLMHKIYGITPAAQIEVENLIEQGRFDEIASFIPPLVNDLHVADSILYSSTFLEIT